MSIEAITGVPGSGKTYLASDIMYKIYTSKERLIYTNVNLKIDNDDYIKSFDIDDLKEFASKEYELFNKFKSLSKIFLDEQKQRESEYDLILNNDILISDKKVVEKDFKKDFVFNENDVSLYINKYDDYLKDSGLLSKYGHSFIVWDECQNDLDENDPIWLRFFSYHRHFNIDIILITQDLGLIHRKYKAFINKFYFGMNSSKRFLSTTLRFKIYTDHREYKKDYIETISLKMTKKIHNFYDSGAYDVDKSSLGKFIFVPLVLIFGLIFGYKFLFGVKSNNEIPLISDKNITINNSNNSDYIDIEEYKRNEEEHIIFFNCNLENCTMKNSSFTIPLNKMKTFADSVDMTILFSSKINNYYSLIAVSVNGSLYSDLMGFNLIKRGDKHENGETDFNSPSIFNK